MHPLFLLILLISTSFAANAIDLSALADASFSALFPCSHSCLSDLVHASRQLLYFKDTVKHFESVCNSYENASLCAEVAEVACGHQVPSFNNHLIRTMCKRRSDAFAPLASCVEESIDVVLNDCDSSCLFTSALSELSRRDSVQQLAAIGGDRFAIVPELTSLCPATACFVSCISRSLDEQCPSAGEDIISVVLRPFTVYAEILADNEDLKKDVFRMTPPTCYPFLLEDSLQKMESGEYAKEKNNADRSTILIDQWSDTTDYYGEQPAEKGLKSLLSAVGFRSCSESCLRDLFVASSRILDFNNTLQHFDELCMTYSNASLCVAVQEVDCVNEASFSVGVSGLEELCKTKKESLSRHSACLQPLIDPTLHKCDASCAFSRTIRSLAESEEAINVINDEHALYQVLAPLCPATGCMVSCVSRTLNRDCEPAGTEIAESLLRPFFRVSQLLMSLGAESYENVRSLLPSSCHPFVSYTHLADIMEGRESSKWASPSETERYENLVKKGNELEEVIVYEQLQKAQDHAALLDEAMLQYIEEEPKFIAANRRNEPFKLWGRNGQVMRGQRPSTTTHA